MNIANEIEDWALLRKSTQAYMQTYMFLLKIIKKKNENVFSSIQEKFINFQQSFI